MRLHPNARQGAHEIDVRVPADTVHRRIAEAGDWPLVFPEVLHSEHTEAPEGEELLRVWEVRDGGVPRDRLLRRIVETAARRVNFQHLAVDPPMAGRAGAWVVEPLGAEESRVRLLHEFWTEEDDPASVAEARSRVDRDDVAALAALKENVEAAHTARELTFSFEDTVLIHGSA
ncbi:SRPBCC family protein, partial [Streptomyces sp. NPDC091271]|uniref:SRPBCC family protein n=1 Tax=Streptomyces sp. NPDC091271 TaxID=3365980 RepID=UPI003802A6F7